MSKPESVIDAELQGAIKKLLREVMKDETASLTDKMKVIDRALKFEQLKYKIKDDQEGSGFDED